MAETTAISWCDSTFNPWIGCTRVGPGCDHCYAEQQDARKRWDGGKTHWGSGVSRYRTSASNWKQPLLWNRYAEHGYLPDGKSLRGGRNPLVFCASLADVFDNEVPDEWRHDLFRLIGATPNLSWLLVTKRIGNAQKMLTYWPDRKPPENIRLLITVCNQEEADRDIPKLLALQCKNGISYEPAMGGIDWTKWLKSNVWRKRIVEWIIIGGESGPKARTFDIEWARAAIAQCKAAGVPVFVKQLGRSVLVRNNSMEEWPDEDAFSDAIPDWYQPSYQGEAVPIQLKDRAGADPSEWPQDLRVREFPQ